MIANVLVCINGFLIVSSIIMLLIGKILPPKASAGRFVLTFLIVGIFGCLIGGVYYILGIFLNGHGFPLYSIPGFAYYFGPLFIIGPWIKLYKQM